MHRNRYFFNRIETNIFMLFILDEIKTNYTLSNKF